jgi:hypothetical protein
MNIIAKRLRKIASDKELHNWMEEQLKGVKSFEKLKQALQNGHTVEEEKELAFDLGEDMSNIFMDGENYDRIYEYIDKETSLFEEGVHPDDDVDEINEYIINQIFDYDFIDDYLVKKYYKKNS